MNRHNSGIIRLAVAILFLAVTTASILGTFDAPWIMAIQPGPIWVRLADGALASGITLSIVLLALTFLFGRFFCAMFCPLGACQDIIGLARPNRKTTIPNSRKFRYGIAAVAIFLLAGGWAVIFRLLDPFSRFAAIVGAVKETAVMRDGTALPAAALLSGLAPLFFLAALVLWKRRIFCTALCPVGTVLGIASKYGHWRVRINPSCVRCGKCGAVCPTGCIDYSSQSVDAERCVLCLNCIGACPQGDIGYAAVQPATAARSSSRLTVDRSRRRFLITGTVIALGAVGLGRVLSRTFHGVASAVENVRGLILPPGAIGSERFARQCTGCQVCAINCPTGVITPSPSGFGPVRIDYSHNSCDYTCTRCNAVCPSGALQPLELVDKQWLKLGEARVELPLCRNVKDGIACDLCAEACPKHAIIMVARPDGLAVPEVAGFHCIGCGVCRAVCPVRPKAITIEAMEQNPVGG